MSTGAAVIAYKRGGATETVIDGITGILFEEQSVECLCQSLLDFEQHFANFDPVRISQHAAQFSLERFETAFTQHVATALQQMQQHSKNL